MTLHYRGKACNIGSGSGHGANAVKTLGAMLDASGVHAMSVGFKA